MGFNPLKLLIYSAPFLSFIVIPPELLLDLASCRPHKKDMFCSDDEIGQSKYGMFWFLWV